MIDEQIQQPIGRCLEDDSGIDNLRQWRGESLFRLNEHNCEARFLGVDVFVVRCPSCLTNLSLDESLVGRRARCPSCRKAFLVPEPPPPEPTAFPKWLIPFYVTMGLVFGFIGLALVFGETTSAAIMLLVGSTALVVLNWSTVQRLIADLSTALRSARRRKGAQQLSQQAGATTKSDSVVHQSRATTAPDVPQFARDTNDADSPSHTPSRKPLVAKQQPARRESTHDRDLVSIQASRSTRPDAPIPQRSLQVSIGIPDDYTFAPSVRGEITFFGRGQKLTLHGKSYDSPLVYCTDDTYDRLIDASLIETNLTVTPFPSGSVAELPYWPSYRGCTPAQRHRYLSWLDSGRSDPNTELGYVFIFFYGLERRVLIDREDHAIVWDEVLRLLGIYNYSRSFQRYATSLLWMIFLTAPEKTLRPEALDELVAVTDRWNESHLGTLLAIYHRNQTPLPTDIAFLVAKADPRAANSVVSRRHEDRFKTLFNQRYHERFGDGMLVQASKREMWFTYAPASSTLSSQWYDHPLRRIQLPNALSLSSQFKPLIDLWNSVIDDLRKFDAAHRKSDGETMTAQMYEALPSELREEDHPDFDQWYAALNRFVSDDGWTLVPISALAELRDIAQRNRLTKKQCEDVLKAADAMELCIEPDAREAGVTYRWNDVVSVFPRDEDATTDLKSYHAASILLRLGMDIAAADGSIDDVEIETITQHLESQFELSPQDSMRLEHLAHVLTLGGGDSSSLCKQMRSLPETDRRQVGEFLVSVAAADEVITPDEVRTLKKLYRQLGLDVSLLESLAVGKIRSADESTATEDSLVLDRDRIHQIMTETRQVAEFLSTVMIEDVTADTESTKSTTSSPTTESVSVVTETEADGPQTSFTRLDTRFRPFLECLLTKAEWDREALESAARDHHLMLSGAIEAINEWSLESCGDWLIDDSGDTVLVQAQLVADVRNDSSPAFG